MARICDGPGCDVDLDEIGSRSDARFCGAPCRKEAWALKRSIESAQASGTATVDARGVLWIRIGPRLRLRLPASWPDRSARFWRAVENLGEISVEDTRAAVARLRPRP